MKEGLFVVIEGADAAGKKTQTKLLVERARQDGYRVAHVAFPQYDAEFGKEIKKYLDGRYGKLDEVDTRFASLLYMMDRHEAQPWIERTVRRVDLLVSDRYSAANIAHQAAKAKGKKRADLMHWLCNFEHHAPMMHTPADRTIYLDLPPSFARKAMMQEGRHLDIHEKDIKYQEAVRKMFLKLAGGEMESDWTVINCLKDRQTRYTQEEIAQQVWSVVQPQLTQEGFQIYFAAPIRGDGAKRDELRRIGAVLEKYGHILTPHVMSDDVRQEEAARRAEGTNVLMRDKNLLDYANVLIAEVTASGSYGVGREIEYATNALEIPTIALFNAQRRNYGGISAMIADDPNVTVVPYTVETIETIVAAVMAGVTGARIVPSHHAAHQAARPPL